jgi:D-alanyl-D-alanine carboxypeptidase/D-alanyl-D-alanine-endopeptidase (penicillin-binding protein 4)
MLSLNKKYTVIALFCCAMAHADSNTGGPGIDDGADRWSYLLDQGAGSQVRFSVLFRDPAFPVSEPVFFHRGATDALSPGSLSQLFTAGAALEKLGPDHRFETRVVWTTPFPRDLDKIADLTITGMGDPSWGLEEFNETELGRFDQIAQILKDQSVHSVYGDIRFVAGDSRWNEVQPPTGWMDTDRATCEGAVPDAINVQQNCATLIVESRDDYQWLESAVDVPIRLELAAGDRTVLKVALDGDKETFLVRGTWAQGSRPTALRIPVHNPLRWAKRLLEAALLSKGIKLLSPSRDSGSSAMPGAALPGQAAISDTNFVLAAHEASIFSPPLKDLLKPMLKTSTRTVIAESLFIAMGGQSAVRSYLDERLPEERGVSLWDGSGLSRSNTASATAIHSLLAMLVTRPDFGALWDALAIAGVDGSLTRRMRGTDAEGVLRGKAGSVITDPAFGGGGSFPFAGYVPTFNAAGQMVEVLPFVVMAQTRHGKPREGRVARAAQDRIGAELTRAANDASGE